MPPYPEFAGFMESLTYLDLLIQFQSAQPRLTVKAILLSSDNIDTAAYVR